MPAASRFGQTLASIIKGLFLFITGTATFILFVIIMVLIFSGSAVFWPLKETVFDLLLDGMWQKIFFWLTLLFFFILPLLGFFTLIVMKLTGARRSAKNYMGWTQAAIWIIGWISLAIFASLLGGDFRSRQEISNPVNLSQPAAKKMIITAAGPQLKYSGDFFLSTDEIYGIDLTEDSLKIGWIRLRITAVRDTNFSLQLLRSSFGPNRTQAKHTASLISYQLKSRDSLLELGNAYALARANKFRGQTVTLNLQIPVGRKVRFDVSLKDILDHVYVSETSAIHKKSRHWDRDEHYGSFEYQPDTDYTMTEKGLVEDEESNL
jgi:heme/copper-type cytochrome/quinol oxidase subunit 2